MTRFVPVYLYWGPNIKPSRQARLICTKITRFASNPGCKAAKQDSQAIQSPTQAKMLQGDIVTQEARRSVLRPCTHTNCVYHKACSQSIFGIPYPHITSCQLKSSSLKTANDFTQQHAGCEYVITRLTSFKHCPYGGSRASQP